MLPALERGQIISLVKLWDHFERNAWKREQPDEQCCPNLPSDGVLAVSDKSCELEGLLDLLEEDLDGPAGLIEIGDRAWRPIQIVLVRNAIFASLPSISTSTRTRRI
jgi:hypothetical protein